MKKWFYGFLTPSIIVSLCWRFPVLWQWLFIKITVPLWLFVAIIAGLVVVASWARYLAYGRLSFFKIGDQVKRHNSYNVYHIERYDFFNVAVIYIKDDRTGQILKVNKRVIFHYLDD